MSISLDNSIKLHFFKQFSNVNEVGYICDDEIEKGKGVNKNHPLYISINEKTLVRSTNINKSNKEDNVPNLENIQLENAVNSNKITYTITEKKNESKIINKNRLNDKIIDDDVKKKIVKNIENIKTNDKKSEFNEMNSNKENDNLIMNTDTNNSNNNYTKFDSIENNYFNQSRKNEKKRTCQNAAQKLLQEAKVDIENIANRANRVNRAKRLTQITTNANQYIYDDKNNLKIVFNFENDNDIESDEVISPVNKKKKGKGRPKKSSI